MARKLGFFTQWIGGEWADRAVINRNAEALETVETSVSDLQKTIARQSREILELRATVLGMIELFQAKVPFDDSELELAVKDAWNQIAPPAPATPQPAATDPYRGLAPSTEATAEEIAAAKALLRAAEDHHFAKRFAEARAAYQEIVDKHGHTKQAAVARQQIANLRGS